MSFSLPTTIPTTYRGRRDSKTWNYKDKPFYGGVPRKNVSFFKKKRFIAGFLGALTFISYFFYSSYSSSSPPLPIHTDIATAISPSQSATDTQEHEILTNHEKQLAVKEAFLESWNHYSDNAWGMDEFHPISKTGRNMIPGGLGWIIIDALDTLHLMNLDPELQKARKWLLEKHTFDIDAEVNVFETTIRMLGGLLGIYHLTSDVAYLDKARDLGDRLLGAYDSPSSIPYASVNLRKRKGVKSYDDGGASSTAEVASLQLEMKYLSHITGDLKYTIAAEKVMYRLFRNKAPHGLVPIFVSPETGQYTSSEIRLGSRGDSYYEYLAKQWLMNNATLYKDMYEASVRGITEKLVGHSIPNHLTFVGELQQGIDGPLSSKMDHLVCFLPGTLALATTRGLTINEARHRSWWTKSADDTFRLAEELTRTCYELYNATKTGLAPEIAYFYTETYPHPPALPGSTEKETRMDFEIGVRDRHNLMRPETVESLFMLFRTTRDEKYRDMAWSIFLAFQKHSRTPLSPKEKNPKQNQKQNQNLGRGYTSLDDVMQIPSPQRDNMESFWLAETLKYLFLIFGEERDERRLGIRLDQVMFNTEAHLFPILESCIPVEDRAGQRQDTILKEAVVPNAGRGDNGNRKKVEEKVQEAYERAMKTAKSKEEAEAIASAVRVALQDANW